MIAGMAYYKLLVLPPVLDSAFKRDLAGPRVVNFLAIAWIAANLARYGVVKAVARRLPWVGALGRGGQSIRIVPELDLVVVVTGGYYQDYSPEAFRAQYAVFKDVLQLDDAEARKVKRWAIRALVEAARR